MLGVAMHQMMTCVLLIVMIHFGKNKAQLVQSRALMSNCELLSATCGQRFGVYTCEDCQCVFAVCCNANDVHGSSAIVVAWFVSE